MLITNPIGNKKMNGLAKYERKSLIVCFGEAKKVRYCGEAASLL